MKRAVVLLSAGLDSLANVAIANSQGYELLALTVNYGQKAASKESEYAKKICNHFGIEHVIIDLPWLASITDTSLVSNKEEIPVFDANKLDDIEYSLRTAAAVWVPNRNGLFINIAATYAESKGYDEVLVGFNKEEAATFPDNTEDFMIRASSSLYFSTQNHVKVNCFTTKMDKSEIASKLKKLEVSFDLCWPCYYSGEQICGKCESCRRFLRAIS